MAQRTGVGNFFAKDIDDIIFYLTSWRVGPRTCIIQRKHLLEQYRNSWLGKVCLYAQHIIVIHGKKNESNCTPTWHTIRGGATKFGHWIHSITCCENLVLICDVQNQILNYLITKLLRPKIV